MLGREVVCPFCGRLVNRPQNLGFQISDFDSGICECGAVYVSDVTGYNQGAAFLEALILACAGDWDLAFELNPEEDYQEVIFEGYDQNTHRIYSKNERLELGVRGVLYFLRLADEIRDISIEKLEGLRKRKVREIVPQIRPRRLKRKEAEDLIKNEQEEELISLCGYYPFNLRILQKVLYSADPLLRWQAVILLGKAAAVVIERHPETISDLIKRLIYASADSAASAWGALEAIGEIIRHSPDRFGIFVKNLFAFLRYPEYRPGALWALGRIGERHPQLVRREPVLLLLKFLEDKDPVVRGMAAWAVGRIGLLEAKEALESLVTDDEVFTIYLPEEKRLQKTTVAAIAQESLKVIGR